MSDKNQQLTIKELAPYLPYNIQCQWIREDDSTLQVSPLTINDYPFLIYNKHAKPILRPLSDLTKEIEYNGEKFVPIEWLFNNLMDESDVVDYDMDFFKKIKPKFQIDFEYNYCMSIDYNVSNNLCFSFDSINNSFLLGITINGEFKIECISNQYVMFQQILEWHFDKFELIENNLAININTLK